jgi:hypothetical protein
MTDQLIIYRIANIVVTGVRHGTGPLVAAKRAGALLEVDDFGASVERRAAGGR